MVKGRLPPGQSPRGDLPRFGLPAFARRRFATPTQPAIEVAGAVEQELLISGDQLSRLDRHEQISDLHCVTTWSHLDLHWSGYRFRDVYEELIEPQAKPVATAGWVFFKGLDGFKASLHLEDALADDVLLADRLGGAALTSEHGAPLRVVAPAHYAYKNVKNLRVIELREQRPRGPVPLEHPRARVALEERGKYLPGRVLRLLYRPMIRPTVWLAGRGRD